MKRIGKIVLTLFMMLVMVGTWFVHINWNTIMAFYDSQRYTEEELKEKGKKIQAELQSYVEKENLVVRDMTDEERDALNNNLISGAQLKKILTGQSTLEEELAKNGKTVDKPEAESDKKDEENKPPDKKPAEEPKPQKPVQTTNTTSVDQKIAEYIAELYICKNEFLTKLANLENNIQTEFNALPKEQKKMPQKQAIINKHVGMVGQWEKDCDTKVYAILEKIRTTLVDANRDTEIVSKIEENYLNEKQIKKAEYMHIYTRKSKEEK